VLWRLVARYRTRWPAVTGALALLLTWAGLELAIPLLVSDAIRRLEPWIGFGPSLPDEYWRLVGWLGLAFGVKLVLHYSADLSLGIVGQRMENDLRRALFAHVLRLRFTYHDENRSGATIARSLRDMERARHFYREVAFGYTEIVLLAVGATAMAYLLHPVYGAILTVAIGTAFTGIGLVAQRVTALDRVADDHYDAVTSTLQENVAGARVVRAFGRERHEVAKFGGRLDRYTGAWGRTERFWTGVLPILGNLLEFAAPAMLLACTWRVGTGAGDVGEAAAALLYLRLLRHRMRPLNRLVIMGQTAVASATRVFEVLDNRDVLPAPREPKPLPPTGGELKLVDVWFGHAGRPPVLRGVSLEVPAGGSLGIIGATGSGKSSLVQLLPRFYDVDRGCILLDGVDVRDLDPTELRRAVAIVFQEPFLFSATVADNVAYGRPELSREVVERCARLACADEFVAHLPQGYDTIVGERGVSLSGGQRQRTTIARALACDPRVLIFDDATASVDAITERALFDGIRAAAAGRTTLVISQRVTSVRWCDRIAVLDRGEVVDVGTHAALIASSPIYREIWDHQRLEAARA
jgi:ATP-binding cassette subfamily B protein